MSTPFDNPRPTPPRPASTSRRPGALVITAIVLIVGFMLLSGFASFWTERLWFRSVGYSEVFTTLLLTRIGLFLVFAGLMAATVAVTMAMAYRFRPVLWPGMPGMPDDGMDRYRELLAPRMGWVIGGASVVMALFAGASATGQWRNYSMWRHSQTFGTHDPYFKKDVGFYVFDLPFWHYVVDFMMALAVVGLLASILVNYIFGGIRISARPGERLTSAAQIQVSALLAMFVLAKAVDYWLDRFDLVTNSGSIFTGMGYTDDKAVLPAKEILAGIAIVCAVLFLANIWRRTWLLPSVGVALFALSAIILGLIVPTLVQAIRVNPNVPDREGPYIKENIDATRQAYALDQVDVGTVNGTPITGGGRVDTLDGMTSSVPLVDPKVVSDVFEQQQQVRAYYSVSDVLDVDRYEIDGNDRALVLGVRELDQNGIAEGDRNWSNLHTVYTHGNGVIAAYANQRPEDDSSQSLSIQWAEGQEANEDALTRLFPDGYETRVYFGEKSPSYSIVGKTSGGNDVELDLPQGARSESNQETTYTGSGGVPVGGLFRKLLYAVKFSEPNFLLSSRVNANSKVLYDRNPRTMVEKVAPWLTVDSDPYPVLVDGKIQWVLDGYTVTDKFPLAQRESLETMTDDSLQQNNGFQTLPTDEINYMRNSVKATVDAYDGTVTLYAWEDTDPILKAWDEVFPGLIKSRDEIPDELVSHLRYPEDLFKAQRYQFQRYHETSAADWFEGSTRWEVPKDPQAASRLQPPYRLFSEAQADGDPVWSLTSVYVPREKDNLAAFMSVNSDATSDDYGKISVLELPDTRTDGPRLIAAALSTDEEVRQELLSFTQGDAKPIFGNLLTLPIGDSFMYVQPLYTRRDDESAYPILRFVLVSYQGRVGIGETLRDAIEDSLDGVVSTPTETPTPSETPTTSPSESPSETPSTPAPGGTQAQIRQLLVQAEAKFTEADAAQKAGNTVKWARLMEEGRALIEEAVRLAG
ncbi:uncharacterized membrane protein (UPF0182 family) [Nocardioides sp. BE266]|uniref:UPF0182 family membrane protein n=1 Tax=Nocardioides sp. BE266 TaxID=2817725 RepID=UPI002856C4E7|nr:UPF0182 family protein [Nocardioides sp. BE266]MDR7251332.1 uncharacterized membrane protein (UPF0182 family) [Nocardioides sp. BE266]